jgi:hypothetical protein
VKAPDWLVRARRSRIGLAYFTVGWILVLESMDSHAGKATVMTSAVLLYFGLWWLAERVVVRPASKT